MFETISHAIADSAIRPIIIDWLMNVPGLPPILQSIHIICVAVVVATAGFVHLRMLRIALPSQDLNEMFTRLFPPFLTAVGIALLSGLPLVIARPDRYFYNPVAGWKLLFFSIAALIFITLYLQNRTRPGYWEVHTTNRWIGGALSFCAATAWIGTILAGRWIAYVDYLYWES